MSTPEENPLLAGRVRTMQIILAAILLGAIFFMAIALFFRQANANAPAAVPIITYVALAFAPMTPVGSFVIYNLALTTGRRRLAQQSGTAKANVSRSDPSSGDQRKLLELMATVLIMTAAPLEAGTFFLLISYMVEGYLLAMVLALILLGFLASRFPTQQRTERWLEQQQELLRQERMTI